MTDAIPSLLAMLVERLQSKEALDFEFKAAQGGLPRDIWPTVSAFANTQGGWIVLGVAELEGAFSIVGVKNASSLLQTFHDSLHNPQRVSFPVCGATDASIETLDGKQMLVLRIPAAARRVRPVYINGNPYAGTYVRRHSGDYHCTKPEVDRMMREASDQSSDAAVIPHFRIDDVDPETLAVFRRQCQLTDPNNPRNSYEDRRFLQSVGAYRQDRETGAEGITVAGLLMLGLPEAIREWRSHHLIDYRLVSAETDWDSRWDDRVAWDGNLLGAFQRIYPRLIEGQAVPFRIERGYRVDEGPVQIALREALVNLLVHADYAESNPSLIIRSPEGYLFRNPGSSRVSEVDLLTGDRSDARNPTLVRMFRLAGLAEEAGSGMPKIMRAWRELGFALPSIDVGTERYEFALRFRHIHLLSDDDRVWLLSIGGGWNEAEQLALVLARHETYVDNVRLRSFTGQHPADVTKVLGSLRDRGYLEMIGIGRNAHYQLGPAALEPLFASHTAAASRRQPRIVSGDRTGSFEDNARLIEDKRLSSEGERTSSADRQPSFEDSQTRSLADELREVADRVRLSPRVTPLERDTAIVQLCARAPLSVRELAQLIGRSEQHVRESLRGLIAAGRITYLYPDQVTHPSQRYIAAWPQPMPTVQERTNVE